MTGTWDKKGRGWYTSCMHHVFAVNVAAGTCPNCKRVSTRPAPDKAWERANAYVTADLDGARSAVVMETGD